MMAYDNETYLASLNESRSDIDRHVQNAQAEVTRQQGVNTAQARLIPDATAAVNQQSQAQSVGNQAAVSGMLGQRFGTMVTPPDAGNAQNQQLAQSHQMTLAALAGQQGAFAQTAPLLESGFAEQAQQRAAGVGSIGAQLQNDVTMRANDYVAGRQAEDRGYAADAASQAAARAQASTLAAQQITAVQNEAAAQRQFEAEQADQQRLFQLLLQNPGPAAPLVPWGSTPIPRNGAF